MARLKPSLFLFLFTHYIIRQPSHDLREDRDDCDTHNKTREERQGRFGNRIAVFPSHVLQYEQIEANGWCDLGDLNQEHDKNAKPDQIKTCFLDHGQDNG